MYCTVSTPHTQMYINFNLFLFLHTSPSTVPSIPAVGNSFPRIIRSIQSLFLCTIISSSVLFSLLCAEPPRYSPCESILFSSFFPVSTSQMILCFSRLSKISVTVEHSTRKIYPIYSLSSPDSRYCEIGNFFY